MAEQQPIEQEIDTSTRPGILEELIETIDEVMDTIKSLGKPFAGRDGRNLPYEDIRQRLEKTRLVMRQLYEQRTMDGFL